MARCLVLHPEDNVAVALEPIAGGTKAQLSNGKEITAIDEIPFAHKIAIASMEPGALVRKYGEIIGEATASIALGQHVHVHNIKSRRA